MNLTMKVGILKGVQILIVDNDLDTQVLYTILLEHSGANVMTAGSIKEALEILIWFIPNILICELRFLGESISTLLNSLSDMEADKKNYISIIVTSTCTTSHITEIPEIDVERYLLKPIDPDQLVVMIENLVTPGRNNLLAGELKHRFINDMEVADSPLAGI